MCKDAFIFGLCVIMCLFNLEAFVAMKSQRVQCKLFWTSTDWKSPMWPSEVFTTCIWTLWTEAMCLSKKPAFFKVLSQRLHLIGQLLLVTWTSKSPSVLKTAGQFSHLNDFSPIHFVKWLVALLYGIFFPQCLQLTSLWEFMCVLNFLPPLHDLLHFSQVITLSSCSFCMCILRCFSEGASKLHMTQGSMATADLFCWQRCFVCQMWWYFRTKTKIVWE